MSTRIQKIGLVVLCLGVVAASGLEAKACGHSRSYPRYRPVYARPVYARPSCSRPVVPVYVQPVCEAPAPVFIQPVVPATIVARPVAGVIASGSNMQVVSVRWVDPGNPARNLGPRFRIVLGNNSPAMRGPFDLVLAAGIDGRFQPILPQTSERVAALAPGQTLSFDLRLPVESLKMAYPGQSEPAPFSTLFVLMSDSQDLLGNVRIEQLAALPRAGLPMVDLALVNPADSIVPSGATLSLAGEGFGFEPGRVVLSLPGLQLQTQVTSWSVAGIQVKLPQLPLADATLAKLVVIRSDGQNAPLPIKLVPAQGGDAPSLAVSRR